ncbi:MAG: lipopolysaccharide transport periplasmic protein LptA [Gammaproteobacteria bacterium]|nr:lipopolysaccharide transport periplasmic protein LptA [Gammaproteobacteria bacterium]
MRAPLSTQGDPRSNSRASGTRRWLQTTLLVVLVGLASVPDSRALKSDRDQAIDIVADSLEADDQKKLTIYRGDVVITQGTLRISGETVIIHYDDQNELSKMVSLGKPARFRQLPDGQEDIDGNYQRASADRMEYYKDEDLIKLLGNAVYGEGKTRLEADTIEYDSLNGKMKAMSVKQSEDAKSEDQAGQRKRIRLRLAPGKKEGS